MRPTKDALLILAEDVVADVVERIRRDPALGRGSCSSWDEVTPSDYEAAERVRSLIEDGVVAVEDARSSSSIVHALRSAEAVFWATTPA